MPLRRRATKFIGMTICAFWVCILASSSVTETHAATHVVTPDGSGDFATIQIAVDAAVDGDIVELTDGIFTGVGNREVDYLGKAITIRSQNGDPTACVIDCEYAGRGFVFETAETSSSILDGVGVTHAQGNSGHMGGAVDIYNASPTISNCDLSNNTGLLGGGILCWHSNRSGTVTITGCTVMDNEAYYGGGLCFVGLDSTDAPQVVDTWISGNVATNQGGGLFCTLLSPNLRGCTLAGNTAVEIGGGIYAEEIDLSLESCTLSGNGAPIGGGIALTGEGSSTARTTIIAFSASGESVYIGEDSELLLTNSDIFGNQGGDWIGAIADQLDAVCNINLDPLFCDAANLDYTLHEDSPCFPENNPEGSECLLIGAWEVGCGGPLDAGVDPDVVSGGADIALRASPNPFQDALRVDYFAGGTSGSGPATVSVFDAGGRRVFSRKVGLPAGTVVWDGTVGDGRRAAAGVYFVQLASGNGITTRRALRLW